MSIHTSIIFSIECHMSKTFQSIKKVRAFQQYSILFFYCYFLHLFYNYNECETSIGIICFEILFSTHFPPRSRTRNQPHILYRFLHHYNFSIINYILSYLFFFLSFLFCISYVLAETSGPSGLILEKSLHNGGGTY